MEGIDGRLGAKFMPAFLAPPAYSVHSVWRQPGTGRFILVWTGGCNCTSKVGAAIIIAIGSILLSPYRPTWLHFNMPVRFVFGYVTWQKTHLGRHLMTVGFKVHAFANLAENSPI